MKIEQLIKLLQTKNPEDRVIIKGWIRNRDSYDKHFLIIDGIDDDCNVGLWDITASEMTEDDNPWKPKINWDKVIEEKSIK